MSKLSFRARAPDPSKPMPIYTTDELPDLPDFSTTNRAVPQMPTGMEKEEESVCLYLMQMSFAFCIRNEVPGFRAAIL